MLFHTYPLACPIVYKEIERKKLNSLCRVTGEDRTWWQYFPVDVKGTTLRVRTVPTSLALTYLTAPIRMK
jgi:hypothetical protein